jgi:pyruvate formate lyase activating enzyme
MHPLQLRPAHGRTGCWSIQSGKYPLSPMRILGFTETSLVDWDGRIASVIFVGGCNYACPFCHNYLLARDDPTLPDRPWAEIAAILDQKREWLDGVCITGGEPMLHPEVFSLCGSIKRLGIPVKIDTNGSFPYPLKRLLELNLCDAVAMDIKAPLSDRYSAAAGRKVSTAPLRRTVRLLLESGMEYEFRSTLVPGLVNPDDMADIGKAVEGARVFVLQQFNPEQAPVKAYQDKTSYTMSEAEAMAESLRPFVKEVKLRGKFR